MSGTTVTDFGFVLHTRPWQETSLIVEAFSAAAGRVGLVARGARRPRSRVRSCLQPFQPLRLTWSGRGSLHTLHTAEPLEVRAALSGDAVLGAFYLSELLLSFTRRGDAHPELLQAYGSALDELRASPSAEVPLRRFELALLAAVGYGLILDHDVRHDCPLDPAASYIYQLESGPARQDDQYAGDALLFTGAELLAIGRGEFDAKILPAAKRLLRTVLRHHLDGRTLRTRDVALAMRR